MTVALRTERAAGTGGAEAGLLAKSRVYCADLTRREARNFYYGLKLLPDAKREAMYALYAYMRLVDDIADDHGRGKTTAQRREDLDQWERLTHEAIEAAGGTGEMPRGHILWPAFGEMVRNYNVPRGVFNHMVAGQRQDLEPMALEDFAVLRAYCHRVASVVGVASLYVFGFEGGDQTLELGEARGIAFQLTNILRDLREDAARGRCYLPQDELVKFGVTADEIARRVGGRAFEELMEFQVARARGFYEESAPLEGRVHEDARPTLAAMTAIYRGLLERIAERPGRVLRGRVALSAWEKLRIGWRAVRAR